MTEVRIGVLETPKELLLEMDEDPVKVIKLFKESLEAGEKFLWVTDRKGKEVGIPIERLAYIEVTDTSGSHNVGFSIGSS